MLKIKYILFENKCNFYFNEFRPIDVSTSHATATATIYSLIESLVQVH